MIQKSNWTDDEKRRIRDELIEQERRRHPESHVDVRVEDGRGSGGEVTYVLLLTTETKKMTLGPVI